jgi:hypothetical protein
LAEDFYRLHEAQRRLSRLEPNTPEAVEADERLRDIAVSWHSRRVAVWLHGSAEAAMAARRLEDATNDLSIKMRDSKLTHAQWRKERMPSRAALDAFIETVRRELGLTPLGIRQHPIPPGAKDASADLVPERPDHG